MNIPFNEFENYIDDIILERGLSYYKKERVNIPEEISPGEFETIVSGNDDYLVKIRMNNGIITEYMCDCPYDAGPVCKHIAGVLYALKAEEGDFDDEITEPKIKGNSKSKKMTVMEEVQNLMEFIPEEEIKNFVIAQCKTNKLFRQTFLTEYIHLSGNESKDLYKKQIEAFIGSLKGRYGYIEWHDSDKIGNFTEDLISKAQNQIENKNYKSAVLILTAVIEEMNDIIEESDDSSGDISGSIYSSVDSLFEIANQNIPDDIRKFLFDYAINTYNKRIFSGWDWHFSMLELAAKLCKDKKEYDIVFKLTEEKGSSDYWNEQALILKHRLISETEGESEADQFMEKNLHIEQLREKAIEKAIKGKKFDRAIFLAEEGIKNDSATKPGLVGLWQQRLLDISIILRKKTDIIKYARILFLNPYEDFKIYYKLLKDNVKKDKWEEFVEKLISDLKKERYLSLEQLAFIYIQEEYWKKLFELVKNNSSINYLGEYDKYLKNDFKNELADLYGKIIKEYLERNVSRGHYETACRCIIKMKKLDVKEKVDELISHLRTKYPRRPALLEELNKI